MFLVGIIFLFSGAVFSVPTATYSHTNIPGTDLYNITVVINDNSGTVSYSPILINGVSSWHYPEYSPILQQCKPASSGTYSTVNTPATCSFIHRFFPGTYSYYSTASSSSGSLPASGSSFSASQTGTSLFAYHVWRPSTSQYEIRFAYEGYFLQPYIDLYVDGNFISPINHGYSGIYKVSPGTSHSYYITGKKQVPINNAYSQYSSIPESTASLRYPASGSLSTGTTPPETTTPSISISLAPAGTYNNAQLFDVTATATDASGIQAIIITGSGIAPKNKICKTSPCTYRVMKTQSVSSVTAWAYDIYGNEASKTKNLAICGNGVLDSGEQCDGNILNSQSCFSQGYVSGTLGCYPAGHANECTFDTSACSSSCPSGQILCSGTCTNVQSDAYNCGACGNSCTYYVGGAWGGQGVCETGVCKSMTITSPAGGESWEAASAHTMTWISSLPSNASVYVSIVPSIPGTSYGSASAFNPSNDGAEQILFPSNMNPGSYVIQLSANYNGGVVSDKTDAPITITASTCSSGQIRCFDNLCTNVQSDNNNCLSCGNICPSGSTCQGGQCKDGAPPAVTVSHSPASPSVNGSVTISTIASDPLGVNSVYLYVDNALKQTCYSSPCSYASTYASGTHTYYATAYDGGGTIGRDPATGTKSFTVGAAAVCGNGILEGTEQCDIGASNGVICTAAYGSSCTYCSTSCTTQTLQGPRCGDGIIQTSYEQCEGTNLNSQSCTTQSYAGGTLSCSSTCQFNTANCFTCTTGQSVCSSACVNTQTDANNCGSCGNTCAVGNICQSGSCVTTQQTCTDSDGGLNYYAKGTVTVTSSSSSGSGGSGAAGTVSDSCASSTTLTEFYCNQNSAASVSYYCPGGCNFKAGACANASDTTPPSVSVYHTYSGGPSATITASVSDKAYPASVEIFVDGASVHKCPPGTFTTTAIAYEGGYVAGTCSYSGNFSAGNHTYYATATDAAGNTGRDSVTGSKSFEITQTAALPIIMINSCQEITAPGNYKLVSNIVQTQNYPVDKACLSIHDVSNIYIDCDGHKILNSDFILDISNVNYFSIESCEVYAKTFSAAAMRITNSNNGLILNNTVINSSVILESTSYISISKNDFSGFHYYVQQHSDHNIIDSNKMKTVYINSTIVSAVAFFRSGNFNKIINNYIDGTWLHQSTINAGADDGILLRNESNDYISGNTIVNNWDCGIETYANVFDTQISDNYIKNAGICGIGGWYENSWRNNSVNRNIVEESRELFRFSIDISYGVSSNTLYFKDNVFTSNKIINPTNIFTSSTFSLAVSSAFNPVFENNIFSNNDFTIHVPAPVFFPATMIIDGGGNICGNATQPYPLNCSVTPIAQQATLITVINATNLTSSDDSGGGSEPPGTQIQTGITSAKLLDVVLKLETLRANLQQSINELNALESFYRPLDSERADSYHAAAGYLQSAISEIDNLKALIQQNINHPETLAGPVQITMAAIEIYIKNAINALLEAGL